GWGWAMGEVAFARDRPGAPTGIARGPVSAGRQLRQPPAEAAVARDQLALVEAAQLADPGDTVRREAPLHRAADAPQPADGLIGQKIGGFGPAEHGEAARPVQIGGELRPKLVVAEPDGRGDPVRYLDPPGERGEELCRRGAVQCLRAAEIEKRLIDRQRLHQRGQPTHLGPYRAPYIAVFRQV